MQLLIYIMYGLFVGIICYLLGLYRGWKTYAKPCPQEDLDLYYESGYKVGYKSGYKDGSQNAIRDVKIQDFITQMDDLFEDEDDTKNNVIDCGEY